MEEITRVRESTGTAPRSPYQPTAAQQAAARRPSTPAPRYTRDDPAPRPTASSGGGKREYKRDPKGTSTGGQFTRNPSGASKSAPKKVTTRPKRSGGVSGGSAGRTASGKRRTPPPLEFGARNDPDRVRYLQRLLKSLKIANLPVDGVYSEATERAVMALQRKLGLTETGRVSNGLLKRIRDAEILSPCANGAKRSKEMDDMDELIRGVMVVDPDEEVEDEELDEDEDEEEGVPAARLMRCCPNEHLYAREWPLDDIVIRSGGDGRTVEAYAAVFDVPSEIKDQHGHYMETIDRSAFNEVLAGGFGTVGCFYHHGMTLHGTPSDLGSVPIGSPIDIRADGKGLRTVTRFNRSALADSVLEAIRAGDLKGYSFRGAIRRSNPPRIARARDGQPLPTVVRMNLGLNEYGPTPTPYYADARILAVRSVQQIAQDPVALRELQRELAHTLSRSTPEDQEQESATPDEGPGAEDQPQEALRSAADIRRKIQRAQILLGVRK